VCQVLTCAAHCIGVLERARKSMLQQQPGTVANHFRGSQAQPLQLQPSPVPGTAVRAVGQAPAQQAKHARLASSKLQPSCAGAMDNAAASASARTASASTNRAVCKWPCYECDRLVSGCSQLRHDLESSQADEPI